MADFEGLKSAIEEISKLMSGLNVDNLQTFDEILQAVLSKTTQIESLQEKMGQYDKQHLEAAKKAGVLTKKQLTDYAKAEKFSKSVTAALDVYAKKSLTMYKNDNHASLKHNELLNRRWRLMTKTGSADLKRLAITEKISYYEKDIQNRSKDLVRGATGLMGAVATEESGTAALGGATKDAATGTANLVGQLMATGGIKVFGAILTGSAAAFATVLAGAGTIAVGMMAANMKMLGHRMKGAELAMSAFTTDTTEMRNIGRHYYENVKTADYKFRLLAGETEKLVPIMASKLPTSLESLIGSTDRATAGIQAVRDFSSFLGVSKDEVAAGLTDATVNWRRYSKTVGGAQAAASKDMAKMSVYSKKAAEQGLMSQSSMFKQAVAATSALGNYKTSLEENSRMTYAFAKSGLNVRSDNAGQVWQGIANTLSQATPGMSMLMTGKGLGGAYDWQKMSGEQKYGKMRGFMGGWLNTNPGESSSSKAMKMMFGSSLFGTDYLSAARMGGTSIPGGVSNKEMVRMTEDITQASKAQVETMGEVQGQLSNIGRQLDSIIGLMD